MLSITDTTTNAVSNALTLQHTLSSGTASNRFGTGLLFNVKNASSVVATVGSITSTFSNVISNYGVMKFNVNNGAGVAQLISLEVPSATRTIIL